MNVARPFALAAVCALLYAGILIAQSATPPAPPKHVTFSTFIGGDQYDPMHDVGYELRYAHQAPADEGGRRIVIATDRPVGFWEARDQPRSIEYPFTVIEMRIKPDGTGEGKLSLATKVIPVGKTIYLEDYATQPVMLHNVKAKKRKTERQP